MTLTSPRGLSAIAIALLLCSTALLAQDQYDSRTLEVKLRFGKGALPAPFSIHSVRNSGSKVFFPSKIPSGATGRTSITASSCAAASA